MYVKRWPVGRKKLWTERLTLPLDKDTLERIDAARVAGEARLDVIREGITLILKRREKRQPSKGAAEGSE
ncbi:hypothetical protein [Methylobacterium sp.]|uniref:hypothetical protein n=1 Tax=Methylobacterium sp. TaxID=409 RepID=UPI000C5626E3|nr:hypothetical protein [Methylobacterium sp.]MBP33210.1 hypothetical protein [Methylobacterium sp.]